MTQLQVQSAKRDQYRDTTRSQSAQSVKNTRKQPFVVDTLSTTYFKSVSNKRSARLY